MGREIERKFLVRSDRWHPEPAGGVRYRQGYLCADPDRVVRVRVAGSEGYLTVKGRTRGIERLEFEYRIPVSDAAMMLDTLCIARVEKTRHRVPFEGRIWEVDVFEGENAGLVLAEIELPNADAEVTLPPWIDREVSDLPEYFNANLALRPFCRWPRAS